MDLTLLLDRCRRGDELAWEALVREYQGRVYGIAYGYTGDPDDARDLAQDIFIRVYKRLDSCREPDRFLPWLIRLARNAAVDHLRAAAGTIIQASPDFQRLLKDVLAALFWFLGLGAYARFARRRRTTDYLAVVACFVLAFLAKPMVVTLPVIMILLDYWPLHRFELKTQDLRLKTQDFLMPAGCRWGSSGPRCPA